jgi:predicted alpha/beta-hydrolase family hydrolase
MNKRGGRVARTRTRGERTGSPEQNDRAIGLEPRRIEILTSGGEKVSGLLIQPEGAFAFLVLAHGAGAGMEHPFMHGVARRLGERGVATLRYNFPYMEAGKAGPDRPPALVRTVRAAVARARAISGGDMPIFAGGKSLGGRMTSTAAAEAEWRAEPGAAHDQEEADRAVHGIVFFGFPLHPPGQPSAERAEHLERVRLPLLFLQGTRDAFATLELLRPVLTSIGPHATLHLIEGADHGFAVPKSTGRDQADVLDELAETTVEWMRQVIGTPPQAL